MPTCSSKNPIFFHQVLENPLLMLVDPASNGDDEKGEWVEDWSALLQVSMQRVTLPPFQYFNDIEFLHGTGTNLDARFVALMPSSRVQAKAESGESRRLLNRR